MEEIIKRFADAIERGGGFPATSKTARKCREKGYVKGIHAMMERWFLIQELYGVHYN